ncbi:MAG: agmatine deiminase family protein [Polyangiaceae bacterium]|nr:agmatine deiminase family protein [Polyangiaceae bacterium]
MTADRTPREASFVQPAEWAPHDAVWLAWPSAADLWGPHLASAQEAFVALALALSAPDERLEVLVPNAEREAEARAALAGANARFHQVPFGDIWLRDTAPIFLRDNQGGLAAACFRFNGWGGKYVLEGDDGVAARIAALSGARPFMADLVLEGGSIDVDGEGSCLTTEECLLNPNRNPGRGRGELERVLYDMLGASQVLWLGRGLVNDHTDGHVDNIARFVAPGVVVCMEPRASDDPNRDALDAVRSDLSAMRDARGRRLEVLTLPSPGRILGPEGEIVAASSVNFYIGNRSVVVPTYGSPYDDEIVERLGAIFPGRRAVGVRANAILTGGGAFHCITQQQPKP